MKDEYSFLWDGSSSDWALLHINGENPSETPRYVIVNVTTKKALLIEDDNVYARVQETMLSHGVKVVTFGNGF